MTIDHFDILACPFCGHLYRSPVYGSYNTFGAKYWTDGEVTGGVPQNYPLLKCQNAKCGGLFFKDDAVIVGETIDKDRIRLPKELLEKCPPYPPEWDDATHVHYARPSFNDLCNYLVQFPELPSEKKFIIIKESIKRFNDNYREDQNWTPSEEEQRRMNQCLKLMIGFIEISEKEEDQLLLAEYFRELGEFDRAQAILKNIKKVGLMEFKEKLFSLARQRKSGLFNLDIIAVRKEYNCSNCNKGVFIFDLDKLETKLTYGESYCRSCQNIVSINHTMANPVNYYDRTLFQKIFIKYKPIVPVKVLKCPLCDSDDVVAFNLEHDKCPYCNIGSFEWVKWDW